MKKIRFFKKRGFSFEMRCVILYAVERQIGQFCLLFCTLQIVNTRTKAFSKGDFESAIFVSAGICTASAVFSGWFADGT